MDYEETERALWTTMKQHGLYGLRHTEVFHSLSPPVCVGVFLGHDLDIDL